MENLFKIYLLLTINIFSILMNNKSNIIKILPYNATEIIPKLFIGSLSDATHTFFILKNNIDLLINVTDDITSPNRIPYDIKQKRVSICYPPNDEYKTIQQIRGLVNYIKTELDEDKSILIYCTDGNQRAAIIVVAYLMKYGNISIENAIKMVRMKRPRAFTTKCSYDRILSSLYS